MANLDWLAIVAGTVAFFIVGAIWYGLLFRQAWAREVGVGEPPQGPAMARVMGGTLLAEFVVVLILDHLIAFLRPGPHIIMMIATGFGLAIMTPAIAINYLHQRKSLKLFLIDAGHFIIGMTVVGAVFVALT